MIKKYLKQMGGDPNSRRMSLWATKNFTATEDDQNDFGLVEGRQYTLWVAQKDGTAKSGSAIKKAEWFVVEAK